MLKQVGGRSLEAVALLDRSTRFEVELDAAVAVIVEQVRARGDAAVTDYTRQFDLREPPYEIGRARWDALANQVAAPVRTALDLAASRLRAFHERQVEPDLDVTLDGVRLELRVTPLARVGLYVPGGTARYPSSVLMTAIPAKVAGVREVVMVTPGASPETMLAARIAGVDRVFELGGAQAVAALAFGTATVPRVDKIVGPGNAWVASAKRQVYGEVDIDSIAGPSEVLIIADTSARPSWIAADLLAQAEHDADARVVASQCTTAGAIFIGAWSSEAAGDYLAGANHVLPTGGAARYASPLGVHDFRKRTSLIEYSQAAAIAHADAIATLATCEGLEAHGRSAMMRKK